MLCNYLFMGYFSYFVNYRILNSLKGFDSYSHDLVGVVQSFCLTRFIHSNSTTKKEFKRKQK